MSWTPPPSAPQASPHAATTSLRGGAWKRLWQAIGAVLASPIGGRFRLLFALIVALLLAISGLNVVASYAGRDLMTAIERRHLPSFVSSSFFTTSYAYGIQLVPPLIVGPLFMRGRVEFGVVTQSAMAFSTLLGAFSLIVTQIQQLSSYASVLARLGILTGAIERTGAVTSRPTSTGARHIAFEELTLHSRSGELLLARLTLAVTTGTRMLVTGTDEARRALFRAMALGRDASEGRIVVPGPEAIGFLPERPHVLPGTWRELLVAADREHDISDERIWAVLAELGLETTSKRLGGLDVERDWSHALSLGEQQLLTVARLVLAAPAFAVLQSPATTLAPEQLARALAALFRARVSYLVLGGATAPDDAYDAVLELHGDGTWSYRRSGPAKNGAESS